VAKKKDEEQQVEEAQAEETQVEETPLAEAEPAADVEAEAAVADAPAEEQVAEVEEPPVEEAPAEGEPPAEEAPPDEAPAAEAEEAPAVEAEEPPAAEAAPAPAAEPAGLPAKPKRKPRHERRQRSKPTREQVEGRKPITRAPKPEHERGRRQERRGVVVSSAMDKTIVVRVDTVKAHPRYKKVVRRTNKFHAHDAENAAKVGDVVLIVETRPRSKTKNWRLAQVREVAK
jgi:small subunit ribosomal protein S17